MWSFKMMNRLKCIAVCLRKSCFGFPFPAILKDNDAHQLNTIDFLHQTMI